MDQANDFKVEKKEVTKRHSLPASTETKTKTTQIFVHDVMKRKCRHFIYSSFSFEIIKFGIFIVCRLFFCEITVIIVFPVESNKFHRKLTASVAVSFDYDNGPVFWAYEVQ